jgi:predicted phosphoribosyltransferase
MFRDRIDAGEQLANALSRFGPENPVVLALPRGGVVVGAEVATRLRAPLDVLLVRKIGHPDYAEYAIGAVVEGCQPVLNTAETRHLSKNWLAEEIKAADLTLKLRRRLYSVPGVLPVALSGRTVILVDDGIATGYSMIAAAKAVLDAKPRKVVVAIPVAPSDSIKALEGLADEVIVLDEPKNFRSAVGAHYLEFSQVDNEEVVKLLKEVNYGLRQANAQNKHLAALSQRDREFPNHWTRYRPVR